MLKSAGLFSSGEAVRREFLTAYLGTQVSPMYLLKYLGKLFSPLSVRVSPHRHLQLLHPLSEQKLCFEYRRLGPRPEFEL